MAVLYAVAHVSFPRAYTYTRTVSTIELIVSRFSNHENVSKTTKKDQKYV